MKNLIFKLTYVVLVATSLLACSETSDPAPFHYATPREEKTLTYPIVDVIDPPPLGYFAEGKFHPYTTLADGYNRALVGQMSKALMPIYESLPESARKSPQPYEMEYEILKKSWKTLGLEVEESAGKAILKRGGRHIGTFLLKKGGRTALITAGLAALLKQLTDSETTSIPKEQFKSPISTYLTQPDTKGF
ncbi:MAG: hypothetical protein ACKV1O_19690 [Saprospiraceae bacterium]